MLKEISRLDIKYLDNDADYFQLPKDKSYPRDWEAASILDLPGEFYITLYKNGVENKDTTIIINKSALKRWAITRE